MEFYENMQNFDSAHIVIVIYIEHYRPEKCGQTDRYMK